MVVIHVGGRAVFGEKRLNAILGVRECSGYRLGLKPAGPVVIAQLRHCLLTQDERKSRDWGATVCR